MPIIFLNKADWQYFPHSQSIIFFPVFTEIHTHYPQFTFLILAWLQVQ